MAANVAQQRGVYRLQKPGVWGKHIIAGDGINDETNDKLAPLHIMPTDEPAGSADKGDLYFDSTANALMQYTGSAWEQVGSTPSDDLTITDDLNVGDDVNLTSDGAIITMGAANPITLTHSANTLTLGTGDTFVADDITVNDDLVVTDDITMNSNGAVLTIGSTDPVTLTHSANTLTLGSGDTLAVTSAATVGTTLDVTGAATFCRKVTNVTSTPQVLTAAMTGQLFTLNKADGIAFTLPAITAGSGVYFEFIFETSAAGGDTTITAGAADLLMGSVLAQDTDSSNAVVGDSPDGTDDLVMTFNGGTKGGLTGTHIKVTAVSGTRWLVEGRNRHSGNFATIFS